MPVPVDGGEATRIERSPIPATRHLAVGVAAAATIGAAAATNGAAENVSPRSDVYAVGAVAYALVTG